MYSISNQEKKTLSEGLKVVRVQTEKNCVWLTKQERWTNNIDTNQGTPFLIYFLSVFMFVTETLLPSLSNPPPLFPSSLSPTRFVCIYIKKKLFAKSAGSVFDWFGPF